MVLSASLGCTADPVVSTGPSPSPSPFTANFNGLFIGSVELFDVGGGECVGGDLGGNLGVSDFITMTITQKQSEASVVLRSAVSGFQCTYSGNVSLGTMAASTQSCNLPTFFTCSNGQLRILEATSSTLTATINGDTATGILATTFNVSREDEQQKKIAVTSLSTRERFDAVRR
jgi:hypothetical protein